jgi:hypothetical protein
VSGERHLLLGERALLQVTRDTSPGRVRPGDAIRVLSALEAAEAGVAAGP